MARKRHHQKKSAWFYVNIVLSLVILLIFGYYWFSKNNQAPPKKQPVAEATATQAVTQDEEVKAIYVDLRNDRIRLTQNYSDTQKLQTTWGKRGPNENFDLEAVKLENIDNGLLRDLHVSSTDTFGPFQMDAKGYDASSEMHFTGGNHGLDNTGNTSGNPATSRTDNIVFTVDGEVMESFKGYADNIVITWDNYITASNTKNETGDGVEVIKESYTLEFNGTDYTVRNDIKVLEDVFIQKYYGLQFHYSTDWNNTITYYESDTSSEYPLTESVRSPYILTDKIVLDNTDGDHVAIIMNSDGLGQRNLLGLPYGAFTVQDANKVYYHLIDNQEVTAGTELYYTGGIKFYKY